MLVLFATVASRRSLGIDDHRVDAVAELAHADFRLHGALAALRT
jgi:hypothetical protein